MMSSEVATRLQASTHLPHHHEREGLRELKTMGKFVAVMVILSYMYGELMVTRKLTPDPRQHSWLLMASPLPTVATSLLYVATVSWWGPRYMSTRTRVANLRKVLMAYNAFQIVFSARNFWESGMGGWFGSYSILCQSCDLSHNPQAVRMVHIGYWFLLSKFLDLLDTVFLLLLKKNKQISMLHLVHHALLPLCIWYGVRYSPGGHTSLLGFLNAFVHVVMYSYYLLAAMGPRVRPFLWWKKYLTMLQISQFIIVIFHNLMVMFVECTIPVVLLAWVTGMDLLFFIFFVDFYINAYKKPLEHKA